MEEQKNNIVKDEHACCSHGGKEAKCCCMKHGTIHILVKIALILAIFLMGVVLGTHVSRDDNGRYSERDLNRQGGCPMMRGNTNRGNLEGNFIQMRGQAPAAITATSTR